MFEEWKVGPPPTSQKDVKMMEEFQKEFKKKFTKHLNSTKKN